MKKQIWKYNLTFNDHQFVTMPKGARILTVQKQGTDICIWAEVDIPNEVEQRGIVCIGTGSPFEVPANGKYIGTVQDTPHLVWHFYDVPV